jgi:hypothetical protein
VAPPQRGWKQLDQDLADAGWALLWWLGVPLLCVAALFYGSQDVGPAWTAKFGHGVQGTFTAQDQSCGRYHCQWRGSFTSDDGVIHRDDVGLATGGSDLNLGDTTAAIDTGDRTLVYPVDGGSDWLILPPLMVTAVGFLIAWGISLWRRRRRIEAVPVRARSRIAKRDYRFVIGPERHLLGRYEVTRVPQGVTCTAGGWDDVVLASSEHRVWKVAMDADTQQRVVSDWGPVPRGLTLIHLDR